MIIILNELVSIEVIYPQYIIRYKDKPVSYFQTFTGLLGGLKPNSKYRKKNKDKINLIKEKDNQINKLIKYIKDAENICKF
jgi:hypothetical protein